MREAKEAFKNLYGAIGILTQASKREDRNLQMPGDGRYQPKALKPFLGYDQWAGWLIIVEWFWMVTLAKIGVMPKKDSKLLKEDLLEKLLAEITTKIQDAKEREKEFNHDILALLALMREILPKQLHKWLHFCATSYDIICTAYALQAAMVFEYAFIPELFKLDKMWRDKIEKSASIVQAGRTHLQTALPVTGGFWLFCGHYRYVDTVQNLRKRANEIPGKFSGAVGTSASQRALIDSRRGEDILMELLNLPEPGVSTQIAPPEGMARFYHEMVLLSGVLANLGDDTRILQASQFGEITSESSSSSAMSHKKGNPIAAENVAGMHVTVIAEYMKIMMTLTSNLQRDLRWSNVMRSYSAVMVYVFQQILTAKRLLESMKFDEDACRKNFYQSAKLVVAELLHLFLQKEGVSDAHNLVNKKIVPIAAETGENLYEVMKKFVGDYSGIPEDVWNRLRNSNIIQYLTSPKEYIGDAILIAEREAKNKL